MIIGIEPEDRLVRLGTGSEDILNIGLRHDRAICKLDLLDIMVREARTHVELIDDGNRVRRPGNR